jgi:hypothetical protein
MLPHHSAGHFVEGEEVVRDPADLYAVVLTASDTSRR